MFRVLATALTEHKDLRRRRKKSILGVKAKEYIFKLPAIAESPEAVFAHSI